MTKLVSKVTGRFNGEDVSFNVTHDNKSPDDVMKAVFLSLTGRRWATYRGDYGFGSAGPRQYAFNFATRRMNAKLYISVLGKAE
jgi:hypothetical protein